MKDPREAELAALVERLRQSGLRLDADARWWHEGEPVTHPGLARALHRWLDRLPDGRYVVRLDAEQYAYVEVADAPFVARTVSVTPEDALILHLSDETSEELDYGTLRVGDGDVLYCRVKEGRFDARFGRSAHQLLEARVTELESGAFGLRARGTCWPIAQRS